MGVAEAAIASVIVGAIGTGAGIVQAREAGKQAERQAREQRRQAELQARIETAKTKRLRRIRQAQMQTVTGAAGITGAAVEAPVLAGETMERAQVGLTERQLEVERRQIGIKAAQTATEAETAIGRAIGTFATTAIEEVPKIFD